MRSWLVATNESYWPFLALGSKARLAEHFQPHWAVPCTSFHFHKILRTAVPVEIGVQFDFGLSKLTSELLVELPYSRAYGQSVSWIGSEPPSSLTWCSSVPVSRVAPSIVVRKTSRDFLCYVKCVQISMIFQSYKSDIKVASHRHMCVLSV